ncbi:hypothetical protein [Ruminococcus sp.]|uniref:hypothetical protein n=1 Tax=Ruminococcus sp. TaxID=41978 RepID=UPI0025F15A94|nr:hypothetical protein [Ruminococcus sp.]MBR1432334.1 hypothetical protein [Ruminococcus sp.]
MNREYTARIHQIPDTEDCAADSIPSPVTRTGIKKKILVPELVSMTKYLFSSDYGNMRLELYTYLNKQLKTGNLSRTVGFKVYNKIINKEVCNFPDVIFWKIDRENFYSDVEVKLLLQSSEGNKEWNGVIECWCSFEEQFNCTIECLYDRSDDKHRNGLERLSPFLVPYCTNKRMDEIAEEIWVKYGMPEALVFPNERSAYELARRMGLDIQYLPVYDHNGIDSMIVFEDTMMKIGTDKTEIRADGTKERITETPETVSIPAKTIIVNTNVVKRGYSSFNIFHECIHYELHYAFFRLQSMPCNDVRLVKTIEIIADETKKYTDPIYFMEKQVNRGAYGLMMPATDTAAMIVKERDKAENCRHDGERYETAGKAMAKTLGLAHFRIRARMIQLGFIEAKGALNYADKFLIQPFAFDIESWKSEEHTFVIDRKTVTALCRTNEELAALMKERKYIYVDGHIVRNLPKYVIPWNNGTVLSDWANSHVDDCCLRFVRQYEQTRLGTYVFGRMYYDAEYVKRTLFYLEDMINRQHLDEIDAKIEYKHNFPRTFIEAFDMLMRKNGETRESMAEKLNTSVRSLREWLTEPEKKITADLIVVVSLLWQLPDWISSLLMERACIHLNEYDRRHQAFSHILHVLWDRGIEEANSYLESMRLEPLNF